MKSVVRITAWVLVVVVISGLCAEEEKKATLAVLQVEDYNTDELEAVLVTNYLRNSIVKADEYVVLDREYMNALLREQALLEYGFIDEYEAVKIGKVLQVKQLLVGRLCRLSNQYYLDVRVINTETSSIVKSLTVSCTRQDEFEKLAAMAVAKLLGSHSTGERKNGLDTLPEKVSLVKHSPVAKMSYPPVSTLEPKQLFFSCGLGEQDWLRYSTSDMSLQQWLETRKRSHLTAGVTSIAAGSGFFYMGNAAAGLFVTFVKAIGVVGMINSTQNRGENHRLGLYAGVLGAVTVADLTVSLVSAGRYNDRLADLAEKQSRALHAEKK